jgi:RNA polymerase sigma-70 factor (ECF subfamily)
MNRTGTLDRAPDALAPAPDSTAGAWVRLEQHRSELAAHCRRVLGSASEADDGVQETLVRAWRALDGFEGRSSLRSWLYRIATNVCLDMRRAEMRRAHPTDPMSWSTAGRAVSARRPPANRSEPVPAGDPRPVFEDPAERAVSGDAVRRAFVVALAELPPRQAAVLILRDVLLWRAAEVAELLGTTVAAVNSLLQRARSGLAALDLADTGATASFDRRQRALAQRHADAFDRCDVDSLVRFLRRHATTEHPYSAAFLRSARWTT